MTQCQFLPGTNKVGVYTEYLLGSLTLYWCKGQVYWVQHPFLLLSDSDALAAVLQLRRDVQYTCKILALRSLTGWANARAACLGTVVWVNKPWLLRSPLGILFLAAKIFLHDTLVQIKEAKYKTKKFNPALHSGLCFPCFFPLESLWVMVFQKEVESPGKVLGADSWCWGRKGSPTSPCVNTRRPGSVKSCPRGNLSHSPFL